MKMKMRLACVSFGLLTLAVLVPMPLLAQSYAAFASPTAVEVTVPAFTDKQIDQLVATLDQLLAAAPAAQWKDRAADAVWQFARRMQTGRLSDVQERRVLAHLDVIARSRPEGAGIVAGPRKMIAALTVGKMAPDISGTDLDGRPLRLSDYRNKVVLVVFSAEWCAICRAQAPYERFLLDKYGRWPFALLGVETGSSRDAARRQQTSSGLSYRSWWDEPQSGEAGGSIASAWNVVGWPASYLIDGDGRIQFVDVREENLLIAVRQLVEAQADRDLKAQRTPRR